MGCYGRTLVFVTAVVLAGCGGSGPPEASHQPATPDGSSSSDDDDTSGGNAGGGSTNSKPGDDGGTTETPSVSLPTKPGVYRSTCDGSGAIAIDGENFLDANDENQGLRVYRRGADGAPLQTLDGNGLMGLGAGDEADLEELTRLGDRVYGITSHGRNKSGQIQASRYHFFGADIAGAVPNVSLKGAGQTDHLLPDMLAAANWTTPDTAVIAALNKAAKLGTAKDSSLAPEEDGLNIEGLAALPTRQLLIGFRNPAISTSALVVTLTNADEVLTGKTAHFGEATKLDLGGLRIRGMAWSPAHAALLILGGAKASGSTFRLFKWAGTASATPVPVKDITPPSSGSAEAIVVYPGTKDVQIIFDEGDKDVSGTECKSATVAKQSFTDAIVHVD
jgi:hypothetical protein